MELIRTIVSYLHCLIAWDSSSGLGQPADHKSSVKCGARLLNLDIAVCNPIPMPSTTSPSSCPELLVFIFPWHSHLHTPYFPSLLHVPRRRSSAVFPSLKDAVEASLQVLAFLRSLSPTHSCTHLI